MKWYEQLHKHLLATVIRKRHGNKHSHEITWFWIRIATWSSLHEPVQISGSSHRSVFKSPVYRVICEHKSESPATGLDLTKRVRTLQYATQPMNSHENTPVYIQAHIQPYNNIHIHTYYFTYPNTHSHDTHTLTPHAHNNTLTNPCTH